MPTPTKGRRMGGSAAHQRHMMANLATALFEHGGLTTQPRIFLENLDMVAASGQGACSCQSSQPGTDNCNTHGIFSPKKRLRT